MRMMTGAFLLSTLGLLLLGSGAAAQDLGPRFKTVSPGIHVYSARAIDSNCTIILTSEGVVLIDSGHNPPDSRAVEAAVKKLTPLPVRMLINTEPHADHTSGHYVFSPPAVIVAAAGATASMKRAFNPRRFEIARKASPEMAKALEGHRLVTPHVEYHGTTTLNVGERTFELFHMPEVHSESDSAIWLPKERILFTAASVSVQRFNNMRPFVSIPSTLKAIAKMRALKPEIVIPGHGAPGTVKILDDMEAYYTALMDRVRALVKQGKTLAEIKAELKMPEYEKWVGRDRFPNNIEAAYRAVKGG
jgi:cyclase